MQHGGGVSVKRLIPRFILVALGVWVVFLFFFTGNSKPNPPTLKPIVNAGSALVKVVQERPHASSADKKWTIFVTGFTSCRNYQLAKGMARSAAIQMPDVYTEPEILQHEDRAGYHKWLREKPLTTFLQSFIVGGEHHKTSPFVYLKKEDGGTFIGGGDSLFSYLKREHAQSGVVAELKDRYVVVLIIRLDTKRSITREEFCCWHQFNSSNASAVRLSPLQQPQVSINRIVSASWSDYYVMTRNAEFGADRSTEQTITQRKGPTVVVVGGTSGIGAAIATTFAKQFDAPRVIVVGRSQKSADGVLQRMREENAVSRNSGEPEFDFLPCDLSSLSAVRQWADDLKKKVDHINYLVLTPGILSFQGRTETKDGLDVKLQLHYYSRFLITHELLPLLEESTKRGEEARVLTVLHAGAGGPLRKDDLDLKNNYSIKNAADTATLYNDLMVQKFSEMSPGVSFLHAGPGWVDTDLGNSIPRPVRWLLRPFALLFSTKPEVCGEIMTYGLTTQDYEKGWFLLGSSGQRVEKSRHHTEEAKEIVYRHTLDMLGIKTN
ncbi:FabG domain-containing protein [Planoprotostelium fungivorum]|uniref:FabG domain-containing protein n=1 Tax=Planoprotostelium fungivorum TaxID=1890364 RepID=A0A2P6MSK0_9EUKA|nr:FabG domain-containing protein [Planoprotostelium fungivorum]